jgi:hypothetical protein
VCAVATRVPFRRNSIVAFETGKPPCASRTRPEIVVPSGAAGAGTLAKNTAAKAKMAG